MRLPRLSSWARVAVLPLAMCLGLATGPGCAGDGPSPTAEGGGPGDPNKPGGDNVAGTPDKPSNALIAVEEGKISATFAGGKLAIVIPATASSKAAKGTLRTTIQQVGDGKVAAETELSYDIGAGATEDLTVTLPLPATVKKQADLAAWVLRVEATSGDALQITKSLLYLVPPYEVVLEGPKSLLPGKAAAYRVRASDAINHGPLEGVPVRLTLTDDDGKTKTYDATTSLTGDALFDLSLKDAGSYAITAEGTAQGTLAVVADTIEVKETPRKLLLTTDKPIYQPGQIIHIRALALEKPGLAPVAGKPVTFEVEDGKGNKIHKIEITSDEWGIASTDLQLATLLNMGNFKVRALLEDMVTEKSVEVARYVLPKFKLDVSLDRPWYTPGATVEGIIDAQYFFGKAVKGGHIAIVASKLDVDWTTFQELSGKTDDEGKWAFSLTLPPSLVGLPLEDGGALVQLAVTATDTADQVVERSVALMVSKSALRIVAVPEAGVLVPDTENYVHVFVSDPLGAPQKGASVKAHAAWLPAVTLQTDDFGHALVTATPTSDAGTTPLFLDATSASGESASASLTFAAQVGSDHVLVRTDQAIYALGDTVEVDVIATGNALHAYVDWLNEGQVVDMRTIDLKEGKGAFSMDLDLSLAGDNRVEAYVVDTDGNIVRSSKAIFVRSDRDLKVSFETDKTQYEPGDPAKLTFTVEDENGAPKVAALGVQIVDQAVFALIDAKPGLLKTYFELEDAVSKPQYEIHGASWNLPGLIFGGAASDDPEAEDAAQTQASAAFAAMAAPGTTGIQASSWAFVIPGTVQVLEPFYASERADLVDAFASVAQQAEQDLKDHGCDMYYGWCEEFQTDYQTALATRMVDLAMAYDFWGNAYVLEPSYSWDSVLRVTTWGPDEKDATSDEWSTTLKYDELGFDQLQVPMAGGGDFNGEGDWGAAADAGAWDPGGGGGWDESPSEGGESKSSDEEGGDLVVRDDFPETLYVNPALITGPDGKAEVNLDMADSITEWRVSSMAHSADGRLGSGVFGVTVFQDFFIDINFPATLTRGDEVSFPIAVYNFLKDPQQVTIELDSGDWYTALGDTQATLDLSPGQVTVVKFPVRVDKVGTYKLTVKGKGTAKSDAVARVVRVVPDGKPLMSAQSGSLSAGEVSHQVSFAAGAVPGSESLHVSIYPAFLSQVVEGLDSMLKEPYGCFEQTTSTTWPNVLVTAYMEETGSITPEIQLKAEALIATGYQRLLTYEHKGGGFSWFGESDGHPFLTVTALGVMEFADMATVYPIDQAMLLRTQQWLAGQQKADGSWEGDISEFFSFQSSTLRNSAFVVWALAASGYSGYELTSGVNYLKGALKGDEDAYTLATVANAFAIAVPSDPKTAELLKKLDEMKKVDGDKAYWDADGGQTSFYGYGDSASVETTAVVTHAMLVSGGFKKTAEMGINYLLSKKDPNGNFGPTSSTVWTLRTLLTAAKKGSEGATGLMTVSVDGIAQDEVTLTQDKWDVMSTVDLASVATSGDHTVTLSFAGEGKVSYNVVSGYYVPWDDVPAGPTGPLAVEISYDKTSLEVNDTVTATILVKNLTASVQNMVLVTVGLPPGFQVLDEDLQPYVEEGALAKFEKTGKQLTLYLMDLDPNGEEAYQYRLRATMPVKAADGGATAYPYYEPDQKSVAESTTLEATE